MNSSQKTLVRPSKYQSWKLDGCAEIISIEELVEKAKSNYLVCTSGGYDPIHPGHISSLIEAKKLNAILAVIVNGDEFLKNKKGKTFMDLKTRCQIVSGFSCVDYVVPFEIDDDATVIEALKQIKPYIFAKGGDRVDEESIPEWETCKENGIRIVTGVGTAKNWSSTDFLNEWGDHYLATHR